MRRLITAVAATAAALTLALPAAALADDTFTVNSTTDAPLSGTAPIDTCASTLGDDVCTLRAATQAASMTDANVTIVVPAGTYDLTLPQDKAHTGDGDHGELLLQFGDSGTSRTITLSGAGAADTVVHADWGKLDDTHMTDRVLDIDGLSGQEGQTLSVDVSGLTFSGGQAGFSTDGLECAPADGGGILIQGQTAVSIDASAVVDNTTIDGENPDANGGGIAVDNNALCDFGSQLPTQSVTVTDSTISGNSASGDGGGFAGSGSGTYTLTGDTFSGNSAEVVGGGFYGTSYWGVAANSQDRATFLNDTITGNSVTRAGFGGGGIELDSGFVLPAAPRGGEIQPQVRIAGGATASLTNVTLDGNTASPMEDGGGGDILARSGSAVSLLNSIVSSGTPAACQTQVGGTISSGGHNVFDDDSCGLIGTDVLAKDVGLLALAANGGLTDTQALLADSPAIGLGAREACPKTDQRGVTRKSPCDAGAYEYVPAATTTTTTTTTTTSSTTTAQQPPAPQPAGGVLGTHVTTAPLLPKLQVCTSHRHFRIRIQNARILKIIRAEVYVNGRRVRVLHRHRHRFVSVVNLRNLPRGTFTVKILARLRDGRLLRGERTYHTCLAHRLPGHSALLL